MIKGITVQLLVKKQIGTDPFNRPIYDNAAVNVDNVLIMPVSDSEVLDTLNLTGKKAVYQLAIPKTDTHDWENQTVCFFGEKWRVIGKPVRGIDALIPLDWNLKVKVESINGERCSNQA